jgi:hypothetical protein
MATRTIAVRFGRLTEQLQVLKVNAGTSLVKFLGSKSIEFGPSIRVNGEEVSNDYVLHENDIITDIDNVSGGR